MLFQDCTPFSADDGALYTRLYQHSKTEISDACLNSRIAWGAGFHYRKFVVDDCLCLLSDGGVFTTPHFNWPIGDLNRDKLKHIVDTAYEIFDERGWLMRLLYVDEANVELLQSIPGYRMRLAYDPVYSDYLYDAESLRTLAGKALHGKRNHVNRFVRSHPDFEYRTASLDDRDEALGLVKAWCEEKDVDCHNLCVSDYLAIKQIFDDFDKLDVKGGSIRINGEMAAFALGSLPRPSTAHIHFEKSVGDYKGIYAAINKFVLENEFPEAEFVNREEDLGIRGLIKAKQSYNPIRKVHKYEAWLQKTD